MVTAPLPRPRRPRSPDRCPAPRAAAPSSAPSSVMGPSPMRRSPRRLTCRPAGPMSRPPARYRLSRSGDRDVRHRPARPGAGSATRSRPASRLRRRARPGRRRALRARSCPMRRASPSWACAPARSPALLVQDRVLTGGPFADEDYRARRRIRARRRRPVHARPGSTCFCTSMGTGPEVTGGHDLVLTELDDGFVADAGSADGRARPGSPRSRAGDPPTSEAAVGAGASPRRRAGTGTPGRHRGPPRPPDGPARQPALGARSPSAASPARTARWSARPASAPASALRVRPRRRRRPHRAPLGLLLHRRLRAVAGGNFRPRRAGPLPPVADPQVRDLVGPVRHVGLRRLRPLHHLVPGRHRRPRGAAPRSRRRSDRAAADRACRARRRAAGEPPSACDDRSRSDAGRDAETVGRRHAAIRDRRRRLLAGAARASS